MITTSKDPDIFLKDKVRPSFAVFLNNILNVSDFKFIAEVGVSRGYNAEVMARMTKCNLVLIDDYTHYVEYQDAESFCHELLRPYSDRIKFIKRPSIEAARLFKNEIFDYVYIDASHDYEDVKLDLQAWWPKVAIGGMLAGHDFCSEGVYKAACEFSDSVKTVLYGISAYSKSGAINHWNMGQMCDWWIYKI